MIGYTGQGNDVYIFIERAELGLLRSGKVEGHYVNDDSARTLGRLEVLVSDEACRAKREIVVAQKIIEAEIVTRLDVMMRGWVYSRLEQTGHYEDHQGFRHVNLLVVDSLMWMYQSSYKELKELVERKR